MQQESSGGKPDFQVQLGFEDKWPGIICEFRLSKGAVPERYSGALNHLNVFHALSRHQEQILSIEMEEKIEKLVVDFYDIGVVKFGNFILKSSVSSPVYVDLRIIVSYPKLMDSLTNLLVEMVNNSCLGKHESICGVPYTALPMATLVSAKTGVPMLIRRKEVKSHGTGQTIEGIYKKGENCIIIEDIVSSGSSILETVEDLEKVGLRVESAFVVLDREQGGIENLQNKGIKVSVLTTLSKMLKILHKFEKIELKTIMEVDRYISDNKLRMVDGKLHVKGAIENRLRMSFRDRAKATKNKLTAKIFETIEAKQSLLCLAADVTNAADLIQLANRVGPHICIFKTHFDGLEDFTKESYQELLRVAKNCNFLILEDRKFSDIGNTVCLQYSQIKPWADLVTVHSIAGEAVLTALKSCAGGNVEKGCFLVAELSCEGNLINKAYSQATSKMADVHEDFVVGLVCQSPTLITSPSLIQLTPGVKIEKGSDHLGQNYNEPEFVVMEKGADIAVVGRGITQASDPEKAAIIYKEKLWNAYKKRIA